MEYKEFISQVILDLLYSGFWIFVPTQALVYLLGRMLNILKTDLTKNILATIATIAFSYLYIRVNITYIDLFSLIYVWIHWASMGILWYVLIGFKLYVRLDHLQDKKIADDDEPKKKKK